MKKTIEINEELHHRISQHCTAAGVTVETFVEQSLNSALPANMQAPVYQKHDEDEIKERLKSLGYID